jgi:serine/alanine adding enzyme
MLLFYNLDNINEVDIDYPDIYFTPEYGKACEYSDDAIWELCKYKDLIYVYLKKPIEFDNNTYYDLITPYGYSGYYYENKNTYDEFIGLFREEAIKRNYITEVLRQNPYLNIKIENYEVISSKTIYGCNYDNKNDYLKRLKSKQKNMVNKALKNKLIMEYNDIKKHDLSNDSIFRKLYIKNMDFVNSTKYYYFNNEYFKQLETFNNLILVKILNDNKEIIGCALFFNYKNFIHYHLSCNDRSLNCITDFLFYSVIDKLCNKSKLLILGGGLKEGDSLSKLKEKISNKNYEYVIYKNIINHEIYEKLSENTNTNYFPPYRN